MSDIEHILHRCLYFTANALCRSATRLAEDAFAVTGFAPSYAFVLMLVVEKPGLMQKELSEYLELAPSTVTRFVDKLERKGFLERRSEGRVTQIYPTEKGRAALPAIREAWEDFCRRYLEILGEDFSQRLTGMMDEADRKLSDAA